MSLDKFPELHACGVHRISCPLLSEKLLKRCRICIRMRVKAQLEMIQKEVVVGGGGLISVTLRCSLFFISVCV